MTDKKKRVRARAVLVGPVFQPVVDKLDAGADPALVSTVIDVLDPVPDRIIRWREVIQLAGLSKSTIVRKMEAGTFPKSVILGRGRRPAVGWHLSEVRAWLRTRARSRTD